MRPLVATMALVLACEPVTAEIPAPDYSDFRDTIYPLLLRDCGMSRCHGDLGRAFVVWGPGRTRLDPTLEPFDPPSDDELWMSYQRTRSSLVHLEDIEEAPLLRKPIDGHDHGGEDRWGTNVWRREDPRWQVLARWAAGEPLDENDLEVP